MKKIILFLSLIIFTPIVLGSSKPVFEYNVKFCKEDVFEETAFVRMDKDEINEKGLNYDFINGEISYIANNIKQEIQDASDEFSVAVNKLTSNDGKEGIGIIMFFNNCHEYNEFYDIDLMDRGDFAFEVKKDNDYFFFTDLEKQTKAYYKNSFLIQFLNESTDFLKTQTDYFDYFEDPLLKYIYSNITNKIEITADEVVVDEEYNHYVWNLTLDEFDEFEIHIKQTNVERIWAWYLLALIVTSAFIIIVGGISLLKNKK